MAVRRSGTATLAGFPDSSLRPLTSAICEAAAVKRHLLSSSVIASVGYDDDTARLEVEFRSGEVYQYLDVDPDDADDLLEAESPGAYLNEWIKPRYRSEHV